mmetsp:Transcript_16114/g.47294  ORF Transcript_16114/g.47294 Transcript_16114/m.47294 type:complete len:357 (-) Transcript_16114:471-1541(-)
MQWSFRNLWEPPAAHLSPAPKAELLLPALAWVRGHPMALLQRQRVDRCRHGHRNLHQAARQPRPGRWLAPPPADHSPPLDRPRHPPRWFGSNVSARSGPLEPPRPQRYRFHLPPGRIGMPRPPEMPCLTLHSPPSAPELETDLHRPSPDDARQFSAPLRRQPVLQVSLNCLGLPAPPFSRQCLRTPNLLARSPTGLDLPRPQELAPPRTPWLDPGAHLSEQPRWHHVALQKKTHFAAVAAAQSHWAGSAWLHAGDCPRARVGPAHPRHSPRHSPPVARARETRQKRLSAPPLLALAQTLRHPRRRTQPQPCPRPSESASVASCAPPGPQYSVPTQALSRSFSLRAPVFPGVSMPLK